MLNVLFVSGGLLRGEGAERAWEEDWFGLPTSLAHQIIER